MASKGWTVLGHRDFAFVCISRFSNTFSFQVIQVAVGWYIYDVTRDPFALGYLGLSSLIPSAGLVLISGYVADIVDRRLLMLTANVGMALSSLALTAIIVFGNGLIWPIYVVIFLISAARSFFNSASQALVPNLVPREFLGNAIAYSSSAHQIATISGPAVGGLLIALGGSLAVAIATLMWVVAAAASFAIRHRDKPVDVLPELTFSSLSAGFAFTTSRPVVFAALLLDAVAATISHIVVLLPIFAKDILDVGPIGLGILRSSPAIGALMVAAWIQKSDFVQYNPGLRMMQTVGVYGLATAAFGVSENFLLSVAFLLIVGASNMVSVVIRHTLVQEDTPNELRGRVAAVNALYSVSSGELGQLRAGLAAGLLGPVTAVVAGGVGAFALVLFWPLLFPELYRRERLVQPREEEASDQLRHP